MQDLALVLFAVLLFNRSGNCGSTALIKTKTNLWIPAFPHGWREPWEEKARIWLCWSSHQSLLQTLRKLFAPVLSCKNTPCVFGNSASLWCHQALFFAPCAISMLPQRGHVEKTLSPDCGYDPVASCTHFLSSAPLEAPGW